MNVFCGITLMLVQQGNFDLLVPVTHITGDVLEIGSQFPVHVFAWVILQCIEMYPAYDLPGQGSLKQVLEVFLHGEQILEELVMNMV